MNKVFHHLASRGYWYYQLIVFVQNAIYAGNFPQYISSISVCSVELHPCHLTIRFGQSFSVFMFLDPQLFAA